MTERMYNNILAALPPGREAMFTVVLMPGDIFSFAVATGCCGMDDGCAVFALRPAVQLTIPLYKTLYMDYKILRPLGFTVT